MKIKHYKKVKEKPLLLTPISNRNEVIKPINHEEHEERE